MTAIEITSKPGSPETTPILQVEDVEFAYGGAKAVDGCTMDITRGIVTGLIGPNGAGKSTLIELMTGFLKPARGAIYFDGTDIAGWKPARIAQAGIIRTFQIPRLLPRLSVIENVMVARMEQLGENPLRALFVRRSWSGQELELRAEALELLHWLNLGGHAEEPAGTLSGGQSRLLEIARALAAKPKLLLLDEPEAGVFPETKRLIAERIREISASGVSIILIAHNVGFLTSVADEVIVMAQGKLLTRGDAETVRSNEAVVASYLGRDASLVVSTGARDG